MEQAIRCDPFPVDDVVGSQFFITLSHNLEYLDGEHTVFGEVAEGHDVLAKLNEAITDDEHRPYQDIRICHTIVLDDPYDEPQGVRYPSRSPSPTRELLESDRMGLEAAIAEDEEKTAEEMAEELAQQAEFWRICYTIR